MAPITKPLVNAQSSNLKQLLGVWFGNDFKAVFHNSYMNMYRSASEQTGKHEQQGKIHKIAVCGIWDFPIGLPAR